MHDHIIVYARSLDAVRLGLFERTEVQLKDYKNPDNDPRGLWRAQDLSASKPYQAGLFEIIGPTGLKFSPPPSRYWRCNRETYEEWLADDRITFGKGGTARPMLKAFLVEAQEGIRPNTWWEHGFAGHNKEATLEMKALFDGASPFDTPKPSKLVRRMIELLADRECIILDFFAGSGTTAHAVLDLNKQDGGHRRFILIQLPEPTGRTDYPTITDITKERVRRVINKLTEEEESRLDLNGAKQQDRGFRIFKLAESNFTSWNADVPHTAAALEQQLELHVDHLREGRTAEDLLYEILLKSGFPLTTPVEPLQLAGKTVHSVASGALFLCLEQALTLEVIRAMAECRPERVVCLDEGFAGNDPLKANAVQIFKTKGVTSFKTV
jgi:adenine-specific DNA-methyltransferase